MLQLKSFVFPAAYRDFRNYETLLFSRKENVRELMNKATSDCNLKKLLNKI